MQVYDFEKNRNKISLELEERYIKSKGKLEELKDYYKNIGDFKEKKYSGSDKEVIDLEDIKDNFSYIENKIIGIKDLKSEHIHISICNKNLDYNEFVNCSFNNVKFENCTFHGNIFYNCVFDNVSFSYCNFEDEQGIITSFENNCLLKNCSFYKNNMKNIIFNLVKFNGVKFALTSLKNNILSKCIIDEITIADCDLKSMKIIKTNINILRFEDEFTSKVDENTFFDLLRLKNRKKNNYENIFKTYKNISVVFEKNGLFSFSGEYYYLAKCAERKALKGLEKFKSTIFYYICGYGERPTFALISSLEIVLIFSIIYMFSGLCINERIIHYNLNILFYLPRKLMYVDFIDCFYFSLVTFTSVGYGDIFPIGYSVLFSCIEMILGVTMVGVWTATLARKITR
ncbi:ion channel [Terrisporobacter sp.]